MKTALFSSLLIVASLFLAGCTASLDEADREFFYGGWKNPKSRDAALQDRQLPAN